MSKPRYVEVETMPHRRVCVDWSRRGTALEIYKVYGDSKDRLLVSVWLATEQAEQLARNLRGKP